MDPGRGRRRPRGARGGDGGGNPRRDGAGAARPRSASCWNCGRHGGAPDDLGLRLRSRRRLTVGRRLAALRPAATSCWTSSTTVFLRGPDNGVTGMVPLVRLRARRAPRRALTELATDAPDLRRASERTGAPRRRDVRQVQPADAAGRRRGRPHARRHHGRRRDRRC